MCVGGGGGGGGCVCVYLELSGADIQTSYIVSCDCHVILQE